MVNFGVLAAETDQGFGAPQLISTAFARLDSVSARQSSSGRQPNFAALNRWCHRYSTGRPSRWALAHILLSIFFPRLISAAADWMSAILPHGVALVRI